MDRDKFETFISNYDSDITDKLKKNSLTLYQKIIQKVSLIYV